MTKEVPMSERIISMLQERFLKDILPVLNENERWRSRSRRSDIETCLPGECPKLGDYPKSRYTLDESD